MSEHDNNGSPRTPRQTESFWQAAEPTTAELIEAAVLDALGVLDEQDADAFGRALAQASPDVRTAVLDEQARLSVAEELLADADAPAELRDRVVAAVRQAVANRKPHTSLPVSEPAMSPAPAQAPSAQAPSIQHAPGRATPKLQRARRVHATWRAATIGLSVAVVSLVVVQLQLLGDYRTFRTEASVAKLIETIGVAHIRDTLLDPSTDQFVFTVEDDSTTNGITAEGAVWVNPDWEEARLFCYRLPQAENATYRVVQLDDNDDPARTLTTFRSTGLLDAVSVPLPADLRGTTVRLAVVMETPSGTRRLMVASVSVA